VIVTNKASNDQVRLLDLLEKWEKANVNMNYNVTKRIQGLDSKLQKVQSHLVHIHNDDRWARLYDYLSKVTAKVQEVSQTHTIIASLQYDYMELRHESIRNAHRRTFDWIYCPQNFETHDPRSQIKFVEWLQHDNGVYWVTGKPGK
jgi:hypothetical protein